MNPKHPAGGWTAAEELTTNSTSTDASEVTSSSLFLRGKGVGGLGFRLLAEPAGSAGRYLHVYACMDGWMDGWMYGTCAKICDVWNVNLCDTTS